jgi:hypothetical protein
MDGSHVSHFRNMAIVDSSEKTFLLPRVTMKDLIFCEYILLKARNQFIKVAMGG